MSNVVAYEPRQSGVVGELMSSASLSARLALIQDTMAKAMKKGQDYGKIPGTPKPTLFKSGAEKLCALFGIAADYETEDLSTHDCARARVKCVGRQQGSNIVLGSGIGECSSDEAKYKWRAPVCPEEFSETPEDRRRSKWARGKGGKPYRMTQIRTDPADLANTVLKMAAKRAHIAMTLNVTSASALFTQDMEDMPEESRPSNVDEDGVIADEPPRRAAPQARAGATGAVNESQLKHLQRTLDDAGMPAEQLCKRFSVGALTELQFSDLNTALAYVKDPQMHEVK